MYGQDITVMVNFAVKRYSQPDNTWSKDRMEERICEIFAYEKVITRCMDSPFTDPKDILDEYELVYEWAVEATKDKKKMSKIFRTILKVVRTLNNEMRRNQYEFA